jgi:integrase
LKKIAGKKYIFEGRFGNKPRTRQAVWRDVKRASEGLFAENVAPHSARKTFAVEDYQEHGLPHTQKALQHDSVGTTILYAFSDSMTGGKGNKRQLDRIERKIDLLSDTLFKMLNK